MNQPGSLIVAHAELGAALFRKRPVGAAGIEVVCQLPDGSLVPSAQVSTFTPYRRRYDVSVTDRFQSEVVALPARDDAFEFTGAMDVGWRVTDAVTVVSRGVYDGLALVRSTLLGRMRQISRRYPVEECAAADAEINSVLGGAPIDLPEGITVHRFSARLTLDETTRRLLQERRNAHYEGDIERLRLDATRQALQGDNALLLLHLTRHRDDTSSVINLIAQDHSASAQQRATLIQELLKQGVIQDTDLDGLARALIQQSTAAVTGTQMPVAQLNPATTSVRLPTPPAANGNTAPTAGNGSTASPAPQPPPAPAADSGPAPAPPGSEGGVTAWKQVGPKKQ